MLSKGNCFLLIQIVSPTPHLELIELELVSHFFAPTSFFSSQRQTQNMGLAPSLPIFLEAYLQLWEFKGFKIYITMSVWWGFSLFFIFECESFVSYFYILSQKTTKLLELTLISFQPLWGSSCIWGWGDVHVYSLSEYLPISISFYFFLSIFCNLFS